MVVCDIGIGRQFYTRPPPAFAANQQKPPAATQPAATQPSTLPATSRRVYVLVTGRVQGVGFRAFTHIQATKLGLTGYVLNRSDGAVEAVIEGPRGKVQQLLQQMKQGPEDARVKELRITDQAYRSKFKRFEIREGTPDGAAGQ
jgi:acylphosphatase